MKIVAAVIGTGIGEKHIQAINNSKKSIVKIVCEKNKKKFPNLKKKFPKIFFTTNEDKIFYDKEVNLVSIASYDNDHFYQIIRCINSNKKKIIVEKPLCMSFSQLKKIAKLIRKDKQIKILSNLVLRSSSLFKIFRKKIISKDLIYAELDYNWGRIHKLYGWRSKIKNYSLILGASIHMVDLMMWFFKKKPIKVSAIGNNIGVNKKKFDKEGFITLNLQFKDNAIVKLNANATGIYPHFHELKIFEKKKTIIHNLMNSFILKRNNQTITKKNYNSGYPDKQNRKKIIQQFIKDIQKNKKETISIKHQLDLMCVCFSALKALQTGKIQTIKYL
tara:strand:- start:30277 stop:31272 length:996 start_codon:yes stop_codon:yes gene_type:complete